MGRLARFIRFFTEDDEGNKPEPEIWKTIKGTLIHITDALASPVKELSVAIDSETGATGCELIRSGKNLFGGIKFAEDFSSRYNGVTVDTENKTFSFAYNITQRVNHTIPLNFSFKENTSYTFIFTLKNTSIARPNMRIYYKGGTYENIPDLSGVNVRQTIVVHTSPSKTVTSIINRSQGGTTVVYYDECGMFEGDVSASAFEPYVGATYPISWQTEAGSITSGTLTIAENGGVTLETGGVTHQLQSITPITLFPGENNIWADCGDTTLTYQAVPETAFSDNADTGMADYMTLTE